MLEHAPGGPIGGIAILVGLVLALILRAWWRGKQRRADAAGTTVFADSNDKRRVANLASAATVVVLDAPPAVVGEALAGVKRTLGMTRDGSRGWMLGPDAATASTYFAIEPAGLGSVIRLVRASELTGFVLEEADWRKLRSRILEAAREQGIPAREHLGAPLVLVQVAGTGSTPTQRWQAAGPFTG